MSETRASILGDLSELVRELIAHRELLFQLTRRDMRIRYKQALMGVGWAIIMPLVVILSGWVLRIAFTRLANAPLDSGIMAGIAVKSVGWAFFVGALGFGTASITANLSLVTKVYFPRAVLPLASVATQIADGSIAAVALMAILPFFGVSLSWALLWLIPLTVVLIVLTTAAALLFSCANVFFRDARHLVQLILSFGIFFTPVFFDASAFGGNNTWIVMLNPLAPVLEGLRLAVVAGQDLAVPLVAPDATLIWTPWFLVWSGGASVVLLLLSSVIFHRAEFKFAEYV
ncbi:MAG TPA: ABC transporter permease [Gemmatimonadaceae bacterium]|nr:ABC transporter permease [Gemmatimonadaceae bacterium]